MPRWAVPSSTSASIPAGRYPEDDPTSGQGQGPGLILFSKRLNPQEALQIGLVDRLCPPEKLIPQAMEMAQTLAEKAPLAVRAAIRAVSTHVDKAWRKDSRLRPRGARSVRHQRRYRRVHRIHAEEKT